MPKGQSLSVEAAGRPGVNLAMSQGCRSEMQVRVMLGQRIGSLWAWGMLLRGTEGESQVIPASGETGLLMAAQVVGCSCPTSSRASVACSAWSGDGTLSVIRERSPLTVEVGVRRCNINLIWPRRGKPVRSIASHIKRSLLSGLHRPPLLY